ncbi:MAG TPA: glycoside hydrolase family 18 protein [Thermoanaerobaculia bacterium]|nr:glycoside hydrolase family 18 protein [Thermoanaerobaculia bacterium]
MRRITATVIGCLLSACSIQLTPPEPRYRIIAYVHRRADMYRISAEKLTHINYAFGKVSEGGDLIIDERSAPAHFSQLQALKAKNPKLKVILSIGGWGADNFSLAAFNETTRRKFAAGAIALIKRYALDGLDLDWEYPGQPGPGIMYLEEDKENFTALLKTLREQLDALSDERRRTGQDRYTLSIATAGGVYFQHTEMERLHPYVDWINIMAYDLAGVWSKTTAHHAGLFGMTPYPSAEGFVKQHLAAGIPSRKLVLGVPLYGRQWCGVSPANNGLHQPVEAYVGGLPYSVLVRDYIDRNGFKRHWDQAARAPFLWSAASGVFITYEDPESLREKASFVKQYKLGGVMYWEQSEDPDEILLTTLFRELR